MPNCYCTTRNLPFLMDFSARDRELAQKALSNREGRRRKANESRGQKVDEVVEDLRRQLHDLLGAKKLAELREGIKRERLAFRNLCQPPEGLDCDYTKHKKTSKRKIDRASSQAWSQPRETEENRQEVPGEAGGDNVRCRWQGGTRL